MENKKKKNKKLFRDVTCIILVVLVGVILQIARIQNSNSDAEIQAIADSIAESVKEENPTTEETTSDNEAEEVVVKRNGYAVSCSSKYAAAAACYVLDNGGNAADAAVALSYALAVVEPYGSGLGGGGCLLLYDPETDQYYFYNYSAEASKSGASYSVLVPGFVSGMEAVLNDFGTMKYADLLQPAIMYCDGFEINKTLATRINTASELITQSTWFFKNGNPLSTGDILIQKDLKETLITLANEGSRVFYTGSIAKSITKKTSLTMEDLANYETIRTNAVVDTYMGYEIASASAPFSGVTLIQALKMAEIMDVPSPQENNQAFLEGLRTITVASHKDRVSNVFDYRFSKIDRDEANYCQTGYIKSLLGQDNSDFVDEEESEDTTAYTIIDKNGMTIASTNTLSSFFGSKKNVDGFFMNNTGRNFGSGVNAYAPGKRPRSHIAPTILRSDDETIAVATPGGNVIVKVLSSVIIDIAQYNTPADEAITKQRVLFKTPYQIYYEAGYDSPLLANVKNSGYNLFAYNNHSFFGCIAYSSYSVDNGYSAIADVRREGSCVQKN